MMREGAIAGRNRSSEQALLGEEDTTFEGFMSRLAFSRPPTETSPEGGMLLRESGCSPRYRRCLMFAFCSQFEKRT